MKFIALREYEKSYEIDVRHWFRKRTYYRPHYSNYWWKLCNGDIVSSGFGKTVLEMQLNDYVDLHKYNKNKKLISASTEA